MSASQLKARVIRGALWSFVDSVAAQGLRFLVFVILARTLEPAVFGLLAAALLFNLLFTTVVYDSIATAVVSKRDPSQADYDSAFVMTVAVSIPAFLVLFFAADLIERIYQVPSLGDVMRGTSIMLVFIGLTRTHEAWMVRNLQFKALAIRSTVAIISGGVVGIGLAFQGYGVASLVAQQIVQSVISFVALWAVTPWRPKLRPTRRAVREIYRYGRHVAGTAAANFVNQNSDILFITYYLGPVAAGVYNASKRILAATNAILAGALQRIALPAFAEVHGDQARMGRAFLQAVGMTSTLTAPVFAGIASTAPELTRLLLGSKWADAIPVMMILSVTGFVQSLGYFNHSLMLAKNKPHWRTNLTVLYAITNAISFAALTRFGVIPVAAAYAVRTIVLFPLSVGCALRLLPVTTMDYLKATSAPVGSSMIMIAGIMALGWRMRSMTDLERLLIMIPAGVVIYIVAMVLIGREELRRVWDVIRTLRAGTRRGHCTAQGKQQ